MDEEGNILCEVFFYFAVLPNILSNQITNQNVGFKVMTNYMHTVFSTVIGNKFHMLITSFIYSLKITVCAISQPSCIIRRILKYFCFTVHMGNCHNLWHIAYLAKQKFENTHTEPYLVIRKTFAFLGYLIGIINYLSNYFCNLLQ